MPSLRHTPATFPRARAAFALVLAAMVASAAATAQAGTCGTSHLTSAVDGAPGAAHLDLLAELGVVPSSPGEAPRPTSCNGPACSSGSNPPLAPTAPPTPPRLEHWGDRVDLEPETTTPRGEWLEFEVAARPSHRGPSVFHPPR